MPGRPRFLDAEKRRQVCALISSGCTVHVAAHYIGCNAITIRRESDRNPEFAAQMRSAQINSRVLPLQALRRAAETHWRAAAWFLERVHPHEFGRREPHSLSNDEMSASIANWIRIVKEEVNDPAVFNRIVHRSGELLEDIDRQIHANHDPAPIRGGRRVKDRPRPVSPTNALPPLREPDDDLALDSPRRVSESGISPQVATGSLQNGHQSSATH